ncbi:hypothetical protein CIB48_g7170 [Xylaria polymorpha]|nr:hypothetical protein CIB48_g7170 [Xylaria polymorpha]
MYRGLAEIVSSQSVTSSVPGPEPPHQGPPYRQCRVPTAGRWPDPDPARRDHAEIVETRFIRAWLQHLLY